MTNQNFEEKTFEQFYKDIGFSEYPFSKWSAEQEHDRQEELFIRPSYYGTIDETFRGGSGMFLIGERGTGKTAAIYDLTRNSLDQNLVVSIDDFTSVATSFDRTSLYYLIISRVADSLFKKIFGRTKILSKLTDSQRLLLSYIYKEYTTATTKAELARRLEEIQAPNWKRWMHKLYGFIRHPLNYGTTVAINLFSDTITRALGNIAPEINETKVKEYFPNIPFRSDDTFNSLAASFQLLQEIAQLIRTLGLGRTIIVLDKLDEDDRLEGDAEKIAAFVGGVITDTKLHLSKEVQIIASIWSVPFNMLLKLENVRTQKMHVESLKWERTDLVKALDKRLSIFSNGIVKNYRKLFDLSINDQTFDLIFQLANKNPRDLWHLMNSIMREQYRRDPDQTTISPDAIEAGLDEFVRTFNYYEYYPRRSNAKANSMDVYAYIRHLLRLAQPEFTRNQLTERSGVSGSSANNYVSSMENIGLISSKGQTGGTINYFIRDPKIRFALERSLDISLDAR